MLDTNATNNDTNAPNNDKDSNPSIRSVNGDGSTTVLLSTDNEEESELLLSPESQLLLSPDSTKLIAGSTQDETQHHDRKPSADLISSAQSTTNVTEHCDTPKLGDNKTPPMCEMCNKRHFDDEFCMTIAKRNCLKICFGCESSSCRHRLRLWESIEVAKEEEHKLPDDPKYKREWFVSIYEERLPEGWIYKSEYFSGLACAKKFAADEWPAWSDKILTWSDLHEYESE